MTEHIAFVALGANLGAPLAALQNAVKEIGKINATRVIAVSSFYSTTPIDSSGPDYVNAVCQIATDLDCHALLHALQAIENAAGRVRPVGIHNAPRTLDLDILLFDDSVVSTPELTIPHPRMHQRAFVLVPLTEIAPQCTIPGLGPAQNYLAAVADQGISKINQAAT